MFSKKGNLLRLSLAIVLAWLCFADGNRHKGVGDLKCQGECKWDRDLNIPGNFSSLRSYQFRITGINPYVNAAGADRCCDMGHEWLEETAVDLQTGDNRRNVFLYIRCEQGADFVTGRLNFDWSRSPRKLKIDAEVALKMIHCNTSWSDVATISDIAFLKLLEFEDVHITDQPNAQQNFTTLFQNVSQIILNRITPELPETLAFVEEYKFPVMHTLDIDGPPTNHILWENITKSMPRLQSLRLVGGNMSSIPIIQFPNKPVTWTNLETGMNTNRVDFTKLVNPVLYKEHNAIADWLRKVEYEFSVKKTTLLKTLDLIGNKVSSLAPVQKDSNTEVLILRSNLLTELNTSIVHNLTTLGALDVGQNHITKIDRRTFRDFQDGQGVPRLEILQLDSSNMNDIDNLEWNDVRNLKFVDISNNSLKNISLMLHKLPSLKMLVATNNNLTAIPYPKEYDTVMYLHLADNEIVSFPKWIFGSLSLEYINLGNNRLTTKDIKDVATSDFVPSLTSATKREVILNGNCIRYLPVKSSEAARTLTEILGQFYLSLEHNPLHCGCEDLKDYLRDEGVGNLDSIACSQEVLQPNEACEILYEEEYGINSTDEYFLIDSGQVEPYKCLWEKRRELMIKSIVTTILLLVITALIFYAIFSNRYDIQLALWYRIGFRLPHWCCISSDPEKNIENPKYDAFIAYSGKDYKWVVHTLRKTLEDNFGYSLFIHDRDFVPGAEISENIFEGLKKSKRMVIIISRNFLDSEWCTFEFRAAHKVEVMLGGNYVIAIVLDDINRDQIPQDLNRYLTTKTFLNINDNWFWRKLTFAFPTIPENLDCRRVDMATLADQRRGRLERLRRSDGYLANIQEIEQGGEDTGEKVSLVHTA